MRLLLLLALTARAPAAPESTDPAPVGPEERYRVSLPQTVNPEDRYRVARPDPIGGTSIPATPPRGASATAG